MQDAAAVRAALEGTEVVFHLAAAVGVGQSMYEISRYMGANTQGTAILLQEILNRKAKVEKLGAGFFHVNLRRRQVPVCSVRREGP